MKKSSIIVFLIMLIITGCSSDKNNESNDKNENQIEDSDTKKEDDYLGINYDYKNEIKCEEMKNAKFMSEYLFVTTDGKAYQYGIDKLFSNEQNCKKFDDELDIGWSGPVTLSEIVGLRQSELIDTKMHQIITYEETNKMAVVGNYDHIIKNVKEWYFSYPGFIIRENDKMYSL